MAASGTPRELGQPVRLLIAIGYVAFLFAIAQYFTGHLPPAYDYTGLWFWSGGMALLLGALISEPFHTRPVDALVTGSALLVGALGAPASGAAISDGELAAGRTLFLAFALFLIGMSSVSILLKDARGELKLVPEATTWMVRRAGQAVIVFSAAYIAALYAGYAREPWYMFVGFLAWTVVVGLRPLEGFAELTRVRRQRRKQVVVESIEDPRVAVVRLASGDSVAPGSSVDLGTTGGMVVDVTEMLDGLRARISLDSPLELAPGKALEMSIRGEDADLVGYVAEGTSTEQLVVRAKADCHEMAIRPRRLLYVRSEGGNDRACYLILGAKVVGSQEPEVRRGLVEITARKIGRWREEEEAFAVEPWVPVPGSPVFLLPDEEEASEDTNPDWIGLMPGTRWGVPIQISPAVTHNTAILGILGTGKTSLAWQLIRRMIAAEVHVVVIDPSRRYRGQFPDLWPDDWEALVRQTIANKRNEKGMNDRKVIDALLKKFLDGNSRLLILDPADLLGPSLVPATLTKHVAESLLDLARERNPDNDPEAARYCLVLEEAHSLVPESNLVVESEERSAVNSTARAILQGRKYGLGCLIISQRTANVAKTILNQCNTVLAMRMYDETGINYLANYLGREYAAMLPQLQPQEVIAFGSSIRSARQNTAVAIPLVARVRDNEGFIAAFWSPIEGTIPRPGAVRRTAADDPEGGGAEPGVAAISPDAAG